MVAKSTPGNARHGLPQRSQSLNTGRATEDDQQGSSQKNRQRASMACIHCRRRKIRCDGQSRPCATCARLGKACGYEPITEEENLIAREKKRASKNKRIEALGGIDSLQYRPKSTLSPSPPTPVSSHHLRPPSPAYSEASTSPSKSLDVPVNDVSIGHFRHRKSSSMGASAARGRKRGTVASGHVSSGNEKDSTGHERSAEKGQTRMVSWTDPFSASTSSPKPNGAGLASPMQLESTSSFHALPTSPTSKIDSGGPSVWSPSGVYPEEIFFSSAHVNPTATSQKSEAFSQGAQSDLSYGARIDVDRLTSNPAMNLEDAAFYPLSRVPNSSSNPQTDMSFLTQCLDGVSNTALLSPTHQTVPHWPQEPYLQQGNHDSSCQVSAGNPWDLNQSSMCLDGDLLSLTTGNVRNDTSISSGSGRSGSGQSGVRSQLSSFSSSVPTNASTAASLRSSFETSPPESMVKEMPSYTVSSQEGLNGPASLTPLDLSSIWSSNTALHGTESNGGTFTSKGASNWPAEHRPHARSLPLSDKDERPITRTSDDGAITSLDTHSLSQFVLQNGSADFGGLSAGNVSYSPRGTTLMPNLSSQVDSSSYLAQQRHVAPSLGQMLTAAQERQRKLREEQEQLSPISIPKGRSADRDPSQSASSWNDAFWTNPAIGTVMTTRGAEAAAAASSPNDILSLKSSADPAQPLQSASNSLIPPRPFPVFSREEAIQTPPFLLPSSDRRND